jgi:hypothetical protein
MVSEIKIEQTHQNSKQSKTELSIIEIAKSSSSAENIIKNNNNNEMQDQWTFRNLSISPHGCFI